MQYQTTRSEPGPVSHPGAEEWMAFLYQEVPRSRRAALDGHLAGCPECQAHMKRWQGALEELRAWDLPEHPRQGAIPLFPPALRWAAAALVVLGLGIAIGRWSTPGAEAIRASIEGPLRASLAAEVSQQVRAALAADVRAAVNGPAEAAEPDFRRELRAGLDQVQAKTLIATRHENERALVGLWDSFQSDRAQDRQATLTLFDQAERRHQAAHSSLRGALETVAVVAADKFQRAETQLGELASYTEARLAWNPSSNESSQPPIQEGN